MKLEANNINESIFSKIKDFFGKKPHVRKATQKEKEEDRYADNDDPYAHGDYDPETEKLKRWQRNPDTAIEEIVQEISKDFISAPYADKINIVSQYSDTIYFYTFENGDKITVSLRHGQPGIGRPVLILTYHKYGATITIGARSHNAFIKFLNMMTSRASQRPGKQKQYTGKQTETPKPKSTNPKKDTYDNLKATLKLRKEHLAKMRKDDPERKTAQIELDTLVNTINKMKDKYQFEHLKSFENFNI